MQKVHSNDMVAHLWANQSQEEARNGNGSLYFHGGTIYSYGSHFPIARHVDGVVLLTSRGYSVTTGKHISEVHRAAHGTIFIVDNVLADSDADHRANLDELVSDSCTLLLKSARARSNSELYLERAQHIRDQARDYAERFLPSYAVPDIDQKEIDVLLEKAKQQSKAKREETKRRNALLAETAKQQKAEFYAFERSQIGYDVRNITGTLIRYNKEADRVESSMGAECPVKHARLVYLFIVSLREKGETYRRWSSDKQFKLGHFTVDNITPNGTLTAGCHTISWDEISRFAESMGW